MFTLHTIYEGPRYTATGNIRGSRIIVLCNIGHGVKRRRTYHYDYAGRIGNHTSYVERFARDVLDMPAPVVTEIAEHTYTAGVQ